MHTADTPPSKTKDFCHLPLHKGGFFMFTYMIYHFY